MTFRASLVLFSLAAVLQQCLSTSEEEPVATHQIEHSFHAEAGEAVFAPCCSLDHHKTKPAHGPAAVVSDRVISGEALQQLVSLAEAGGVYRLRVRSSVDGPFVMAFAPACSLLASNLKEEWRLTVDQFDNVVAMDVIPKQTDCRRLDLSKWQHGEHKIMTSVKIEHPWRGIRPEMKKGPNKGSAPQSGASSQAPQGQSGGQPQGDSGEPQEQQSFLRRYWLYIVIPILYLMLSSLPQEEGQAAGKAGARAAAKKK